MNSQQSRSFAHRHSNSSSEAISPLEQGRVVAALDEYVQLLQGGCRPGRAEFLAFHHSIAHILGDRLEGLEFVQGALRPMAQGGLGSGQAEESLLLRGWASTGSFARSVAVAWVSCTRPSSFRSAAALRLKVLPSTASLDPRQRRALPGRGAGRRVVAPRTHRADLRHRL